MQPSPPYVDDSARTHLLFRRMYAAATPAILPMQIFYGLGSKSPRAPFLLQSAHENRHTCRFFAQFEQSHGTQIEGAKRREVLKDMLAAIANEFAERVGLGRYRCRLDGQQLHGEVAMLNHVLQVHGPWAEHAIRTLLTDHEEDQLGMFFTKLFHADFVYPAVGFPNIRSSGAFATDFPSVVAPDLAATERAPEETLDQPGQCEPEENVPLSVMPAAFPFRKAASLCDDEVSQLETRIFGAPLVVSAQTNGHTIRKGAEPVGASDEAEEEEIGNKEEEEEDEENEDEAHTDEEAEEEDEDEEEIDDIAANEDISVLEAAIIAEALSQHSAEETPAQTAPLAPMEPAVAASIPHELLEVVIAELSTEILGEMVNSLVDKLASRQWQHHRKEQLRLQDELERYAKAQQAAVQEALERERRIQAKKERREQRKLESAKSAAALLDEVVQEVLTALASECLAAHKPALVPPSASASHFAPQLPSLPLRALPLSWQGVASFAAAGGDGNAGSIPFVILPPGLTVSGGGGPGGVSGASAASAPSSSVALGAVPFAAGAAAWPAAAASTSLLPLVSPTPAMVATPYGLVPLGLMSASPLAIPSAAARPSQPSAPVAATMTATKPTAPTKITPPPPSAPITSLTAEEEDSGGYTEQEEQVRDSEFGAVSYQDISRNNSIITAAQWGNDWILKDHFSSPSSTAAAPTPAVAPTTATSTPDFATSWPSFSLSPTITVPPSVPAYSPPTTQASAHSESLFSYGFGAPSTSGTVPNPATKRSAVPLGSAQWKQPSPVDTSQLHCTPEDYQLDSSRTVLCSQLPPFAIGNQQEIVAFFENCQVARYADYTPKVQFLGGPGLTGCCFVEFSTRMDMERALQRDGMSLFRVPYHAIRVTPSTSSVSQSGALQPPLDELPFTGLGALRVPTQSSLLNTEQDSVVATTQRAPGSTYYRQPPGAGTSMPKLGAGLQW